MATTSRRISQPASANPIPSSSPAFGTPVHPLRPHQTAAIPASSVLKPTILPVLLPPATLRPLAFRTFTKKHNLTLTSSALGALAAFIGRHCGSGWREEGLAEGVLEEVAKSWKKGGGQVIVDGESGMLRSILKTLEGCVSGGKIVQGKSSLSRQGSFAFGADGNAQDLAPIRPGLGDSQSSFGMSRLDVIDQEEEEDVLKDPREWIKVIGAFEQPRLVYNVGKKHFEKSSTKPSLFPPSSHKTELFRQRYHLIHQRTLRNESFQTPSFSGNRIPSLHRSASVSTNSTNKITPIANLLGRTGSCHLLLGLLAVSPTGTLALSDLTGSIALDLQHARPIPEDGAWFAPGMIVLVEGVYEEDYGAADSGLGNTGGVGGTIGGRFLGISVAHPPCERRAETLGIADDPSVKQESVPVTGPAFGWTDFLGLGSERATGARMRRLEKRILGPGAQHAGNGRIAIAAEINLDNPSTLAALRTMLGAYASLPIVEFPMAIILMGNFVSTAAMAGAPGAGSIEYKEYFNALASVLAEFPALIARTTLVFVPGDNDAWPSTFSAGAATPVPRKAVPDVFTSRIRRTIAEANREVGGGGAKGGRKEGEAIWTTNPARVSWFGTAGEMVVFRDDVSGRLRRTAVRFRPPGEEDNAAGTAEEAPVDQTTPDILPAAELTTSPAPAADTTTAMDIDPPPAPAPATHPPPTTSTPTLDPDTRLARRLTKTLLDQSHLSPFPPSTRPVHWDFAAALQLYPLPTALVVADADAPAFALSYCGCCVLNPGALVVGRWGRGGRARWVEFEVGVGRGRVRVEG